MKVEAKNVCKVGGRSQTTLTKTRQVDASGNVNCMQIFPYAVKLGDKEHFDKEQVGVKEPFPAKIFNLLYKDKDHLGSSPWCRGERWTCNPRVRGSIAGNFKKSCLSG